MNLIFCSDPSNSQQPDESYQAEDAAAERFAFSFALVDHDALVHENDPVKAIRWVPQQPIPGPAVYCGWMLTPDQWKVTRIKDAELHGESFIHQGGQSEFVATRAKVMKTTKRK